MTKQLKLSALLVALLASTAFAEDLYDTTATKGLADRPGYTADQPTNNISRNNYGECWRTTYFDKATQGAVECGDATAAVVEQPRYTTETSREEFSIPAAVLFGFDKSTLRPQASEHLRPYVEKAADVNITKVTVIGHTDSIGSDKYNDALSLRRANTVRSFLVNNGIPESKVYAEGRGKREARMTAQCEQQVAKLGRVSAAKKRQALIACIEPDRRVNIVFEGVVEKERRVRVEGGK
ncbi:OmpA family protein [Neisseria sp. Ec49-e6-T10]|uniref:OmpA family protein n=1 Tax=Neisseria sp. Ec49-e6-T10 TaxID=3140744 RepID=UPI003EBC33A5